VKGTQTLGFIGNEIASRRKALGLNQTELAARAGTSRATLDALENGRAGEIGYSKLTKILATLGLELRMQEATGRQPTLDDLLAENAAEDRHDQDLDRRR
jgi:transcriptional regulator with XRE-family HTH domain